MGRVPQRTDLIDGLQGMGESLRGAEVLLNGVLTLRLSEAQAAIADADAAAAAAQAAAQGANNAAIDAQTSAQNANNAAIDAQGAANNAQIAANSASNAANNAQGAANNAQAAADNANGRAAYLENLDVWRASGQSSSPVLPTSYGVAPDMSISLDFGGMPLFIFFSCDLALSGSGSTATIGLFQGGNLIANSERSVRLSSGEASISVIAEFAPAPGNIAVDARWKQTTSGSIESPFLRRELSILRVPN